MLGYLPAAQRRVGTSLLAIKRSLAAYCHENRPYCLTPPPPPKSRAALRECRQNVLRQQRHTSASQIYSNAKSTFLASRIFDIAVKVFAQRFAACRSFLFSFF